MAVTAIENEAEFTLRVLHHKGVVLVDFWADWCEPCETIRAEIKKAAASFAEHVDIYKVDIDALRPLAKQYDIMAVPTLLFFKNGQQVKRIIGYAAQEEIEKVFESLVNP